MSEITKIEKSRNWLFGEHCVFFRSVMPLKRHRGLMQEPWDSDEAEGAVGESSTAI